MRFESVIDIGTSVTRVFQKLPDDNEFRKSDENWRECWTHCVAAAQWEYFEGDYIDDVPPFLNTRDFCNRYHYLIVRPRVLYSRAHEHFAAFSH